jgi:signal peptidase I
VTDSQGVSPRVPDDRPSTPEGRADHAPPSEGGFADPSSPFDGPGGDSLDRLRADAQERGEKEDARRSFWRELPVLVLVALVVAILIKTFLVQAFFIPSASMRDTLLEGDRVMVNKLAYRFGDPAPGDVIVFDSPLHEDDGENFVQAILRNVGESLGLSSPDSALIKRVIAVGGQTITIRDNTVYVDDVAIDEPYIRTGSRMPDFGPVTVPDDHVFVMGDNRSASQDSRRFGPIAESTIIGKAFVKVWPPGRWGGL